MRDGESDAVSDRPVAAADGPPDELAVSVFGAHIDVARRYADLLADTGVQHGHLGPREVPRLWDRHLVNSALLADLLPEGARVVDLGSGAGLPGIPVAIRRPDLTVDLVEPMLRRVAFLTDALARLGLERRVRVVRGRADDAAVLAEVGNVEFVVSRAVAPLDRLVRWCLPLLAPGGSLLAMKGASAQAEVDRYGATARRTGAARLAVIELGSGSSAGTWVVQVERAARSGSRRRRRSL